MVCASVSASEIRSQIAVSRKLPFGWRTAATSVLVTLRTMSACIAGMMLAASERIMTLTSRRRLIFHANRKIQRVLVISWFAVSLSKRFGGDAVVEVDMAS